MALLAVEVLELGRRPHVVRGEPDELGGGQVPPPGVAEDDVDPGVAGATEPWLDPLGERRLVPAVAGQDHLGVRWRVVQHVATDDRDAPAVRPRVELDRRRGEGIDVRGRRRRGTRLECRDRTQPGPGREIEDPAPGHGLRVLAQVVRDAQSTAPCKRPVGQRGIRVRRLHLDGVPQRQDLVGEVQADRFQPGDGPEPPVPKDERALAGHGQARPAATSSTNAPTIDQ